MKTILKALVFLCFAALPIAAQTTVTGTITDTDSLAWAGATLTITAQGAIPPGTPSQYSAVANSSGAYSVTLPKISTSGGTWVFQIAAVTSVGVSIPSVWSSAPIAIANGSATENFTPPGPRFPDPGFAFGYGTVEVQPLPTYGVIFQIQPGLTSDWYTPSGWVAGPGGGGTTLPYPGLVYGTSATGGNVATGAQVAAPLSGQTISPKIINGVSYSNLYTGSTLDVRVNACIADAETLANGNTSGICDSTGEGSAQTIAAQITVGDTGLNPVTWRIPGSCTWTIQAGTTGAAIMQYGNSTIEGPGIPPSTCTINSNATTISSLYEVNTQGGAGGYFRASGFTLRAYGYAPTSGEVALIEGGYDTSEWKNIHIENATASVEGLLIGNGTDHLCCASHLDGISIDGEYIGSTLLDIEGGTSTPPIAVYFNDLSLAHPATSSPAMTCNATSGGQTSVAFYGVYEEIEAANTATLNQISDCRTVSVFGLNVDSASGTGSAPAFSVGSLAATALSIIGLHMNNYNTSGSPLPTAVTNSTTGETIYTDRFGSLSEYEANISYATSVMASGIVDGRAPMAINATAAFTFGGGTYQSGYTISNDGSTAVTGTLPVAAAGKQFCVRNIATATSALTIQTSGTGQYIDNAGTYTASGGYVVSGGALADAACIVAIDSTHWELYINSGTWVTH